MESYIEVPEYTALGDGDLGVQVLAIFRAFPWRLDAALVREGWATPRWYEGRPSGLFPMADELEALWDYLVEHGGNGITWDLDGWTVRDIDDVSPLLTARTAEVIASTHGPMGEPITVHLDGETAEPVDQASPREALE